MLKQKKGNGYMINSNSQGKSFAHERIVERTLTERVIEKPFTTEPRFRIYRGHTITIRRCYNIAKHLKQCGFKTGDILKDDDVDNAVFHCVGGDYRTAKRYKGYDIFSRPKFAQGAMVEPGRYIKHVKGYLERLHILTREGNGYRLFLAVVEFTNDEASGISITNLCVQGLGKVNVFKGMENGATKHSTTTTTQHTQISQVKVNDGRNESFEKPKAYCEHIEAYHSNSTRHVDLTEEETKVLNAAMFQRGQIKCVDCGTVDQSNPYRVLCPKGLGLRTRQDVCVLEGGS